MRIALLQHTPDTPPAFTTTWLQQNKYPYRLIKAFQGEPLPEVSEIDWLVALGGGMNVDDEKNHPFLRDEKSLLEQVLKNEKTFLGLCLGGQMLARVMGARVRKHSDWEVGWHSVHIENHSVGLKMRHPEEELHVFQYHQDTFDNPTGAIPFARNSITPNQGFITANSCAVATQFHPEADASWIKECAEDEDYPQGLFVQKPNEVVADTQKYLSQQSSWFSDLMTTLATQTKARS